MLRVILLSVVFLGVFMRIFVRQIVLLLNVFMLSDLMLNVHLLSVILLNGPLRSVVMASIITLSVVLTNVVAPGGSTHLHSMIDRSVPD